jgi:arginyl-tRNA synthetase
VQYAHARICSVLARDIGSQNHAAADLSMLVAPSEAALMLKLAEFPEMLSNAAAGLAPHDVTFYLRDVAGAFHSYYGAERFLVADAGLARARLALLVATRQVIRNALGVLGVSAPDRMDRDLESNPEATVSETP